jgi:hypothetical protein
MALSMEKYWIKNLNAVAVDRGMGLFSPSTYPLEDRIGIGLGHWVEVWNALEAKSSARAVAVLPVAVLSEDTAITSETALPSKKKSTPAPPVERVPEMQYDVVYPNLAAEGFKMGAPNRVEDEAAYVEFVSALTGAVDAVHGAGVVHGDLYASNVFWRRREKREGDPGGIEIRLVDWDRSYLAAWAGALPSVDDVIEKAFDRLGLQPQGKPDDVDTLLLRAYATPRDRVADDVWRGLASTRKEDVDEAFWSLVAELEPSADADNGQ